MSFLNKTFIHDKDENFKELMESLELPDDELKKQVDFKPSYTLKKDGDQYILSMTYPDGNSDVKFKDGVEFDDEVAPGIVAKIKVSIEGNVVNQIHKFDDDLTMVYRGEYSGDKLVLEITSNKWDGTARRYFTAA